jgi:hypothetical protein
MERNMILRDVCNNMIMIVEEVSEATVTLLSEGMHVTKISRFEAESLLKRKEWIIVK